MIKESLSSNILARWDLRTGSLIDKSGNGFDITVGGAPLWNNSPQGKFVKLDGVADYLDVGNTAGAVKSITLKIKADNIAATTDYVIDLNGTDYITIVNGTVTVNGFGGASTSIYVNGSEVSTISALETTHITITSDTAFTGGDVDIGRLEGTGFFGGGVLEVILWDVELTSAQASQLSNESAQEAHIGTLGKRNFVLPENIKGNETNLVGGWNMDIRGDTVYDVSTGNNNMTKNGGASDVPGLFGRAQEFDGSTGYLQKTVANYRSSDSLGSFVAWVKVNSTGSNKSIFSKAQNALTSRFISFLINNANKLEVWQINNAAADIVHSTNSVVIGQWHHVVITSNGSRYKFYIDGQEETAVVDGGANSGDWFADTEVGEQISIGSLGRSPHIFHFNGAIGNVEIYDAELSQAEVTALYNKGAKKPIYRNTFEDAEVTLGVNTTDLNDFDLISGTFKISEDGTDKWLESVTSGVALTPSTQAFGTWQFDMYKQGVSNLLVSILADERGGIGVTGQDGYSFLFASTETLSLRLDTNGAAVLNVMITGAAYAAALTKYSVRITRDYLGAFTMYIKGGAFTNWTLVDVSGGAGTNPATNITHTASLFLGLTMSAGDKISNIKIFEGVLDTTNYPNL